MNHFRPRNEGPLDFITGLDSFDFSTKPRAAFGSRWFSDALDHVDERDGQLPPITAVIRALHHLTSRVDLWSSPENCANTRLKNAMLLGLETNDYQSKREERIPGHVILERLPSHRTQIHPHTLGPVGRKLPISAARRTESFFSLIELLLPKRLAAEELGDALEMTKKMVHDSCPAWRIYLKLFSTVFWVSINAVREVSGAALGRKGA